MTDDEFESKLACNMCEFTYITHSTSHRFFFMAYRNISCVSNERTWQGHCSKIKESGSRWSDSKDDHSAKSSFRDDKAIYCTMFHTDCCCRLVLLAAKSKSAKSTTTLKGHKGKFIYHKHQQNVISLKQLNCLILPYFPLYFTFFKTVSWNFKSKNE